MRFLPIVLSYALALATATWPSMDLGAEMKGHLPKVIDSIYEAASVGSTPNRQALEALRQTYSTFLSPGLSTRKNSTVNEINNCVALAKQFEAKAGISYSCECVPFYRLIQCSIEMILASSAVIIRKPTLLMTVLSMDQVPRNPFTNSTAPPLVKSIHRGLLAMARLMEWNTLADLVLLRANPSSRHMLLANAETRLRYLWDMCTTVLAVDVIGPDFEGTFHVLYNTARIMSRTLYANVRYHHHWHERNKLQSSALHVNKRKANIEELPGSQNSIEIRVGLDLWTGIQFLESVERANNVPFVPEDWPTALISLLIDVPLQSRPMIVYQLIPFVNNVRSRVLSYGSAEELLCAARELPNSCTGTDSDIVNTWLSMFVLMQHLGLSSCPVCPLRRLRLANGMFELNANDVFLKMINFKIMGAPNGNYTMGVKCVKFHHVSIRAIVDASPAAFWLPPYIYTIVREGLPSTGLDALLLMERLGSLDISLKAFYFALAQRTSVMFGS